MNPEIYLSPAEKLAFANSGDDAAKSLYQQGAAGAITLESCKGLTIQEQDSLLTSISADKFTITAPTKTALLGFLAECKKTSTSVAPAVIGGAPTTVAVLAATPSAIGPVADKAFATIDAKIKKENPDGSHLSNWRALWKIFPGTEPTIDPTADDLKQVINQSRQWNRELLNGLVKEYNNDSSKLPVNWLNSNLPGWFPTLKKNHNFDIDGYKGQFGVNAKRIYIIDVIGEIEKAWNEAEKGILAGPTEWAGDKLVSLFVWGFLPVTSTLFAGKLIYNIAHKKPDPLEAASWAADKTWQGTKKAATFGKSAMTTAYKSVNGKFITKVESKDLKDTPAYDADGWAKERARLEETTRRMIYMDSGVNPRHNPNATSAEIFRDVEGTPALKTAYDARMVKLTELGNTLVGQEKFLSQEAFNKEAGKIVAGDIGESSVKKSVLKRVPFTAERSDYKQTQAALKKVKGEIDTMRARLSAKAMMDGVEIPKALEAQLKAFEDAHKAAYEADLSLDKSRNQIARTGDRINAINEVIAHFEEIDTLEGKITDVKAKITAVEGRITAQRNAAHTESVADTRTRDLQGIDAEIGAAKDALDQARRDQEKLENDIKEAKKEVKAAQNRIEEREKELKDAIATREKELKDAIATREKELKDAIAKSEASQEAQNPDEAKKRDTWNKELRREDGSLKKLSDELSGSDNRLKSLNDELGNRTGDLKKRDDEKTDASDKLEELDAKKPATAQKINDAFDEHKTKVSDKRAILTRGGGVDAKLLTITDQAEFDKLKIQKGELEGKIKEAKGKIDALAVKPENRGFPRSTGGTLALAQAELARLDGLIAPGGTLDMAKSTAKIARNTAFTHMNTTIVTLNTESARLGEALEIKIPHITEFRQGQGFSEDLSMRENGLTGESKAVDQKLKGARPNAVKTILNRGK